MNILTFNRQPVAANIYGSAPDGPVAVNADAEGRPLLSLDATQTVAASALHIRDLNSARDTAAITAGGFDIRSLTGGRDSVSTVKNIFQIVSNTVTLLLGGTVVLTVDTKPYSQSAFLVRAEAVSLLTTVYLQLAPLNTGSYFETVATESGLILGGRYLLVPTMPLRYARIFATGVGSRLTAYYVGQI